MYEGGIRLLEITYNPSHPETDTQTAEQISTLVKRFGDKMLIGAGTVLTKKQVVLTHKAGGSFIISPNTNKSLIKKNCKLGMVSIPGALTPSECILAHNAGADFVKLFPVSDMGSAYLKALKSPFRIYVSCCRRCKRAKRAGIPARGSDRRGNRFLPR